MEFDYRSYLLGKLRMLAVELKFDVSIDVSEEQNFAKMDEFTPDTIYVVIKYLSSDIQYDAETTPIQLLVLSEQNSLDKARALMDEFTSLNNWSVNYDGDLFIKHQYNSPVVLNNYVEVTYGYRSVLYVSGTLFIMKNVMDIKDITVNGNAYKPLNFSLAYSMSTNTQQLPSEEIASSLKTVSTLSLTMSIPMVKKYNTNDLATDVMKIIKEDKTGNSDFVISFDCGLTKVVDGVTVPDLVSKTMRLISAQIITAPNQVPSLQLGFMK